MIDLGADLPIPWSECALCFMARRQLVRIDCQARRSSKNLEQEVNPVWGLIVLNYGDAAGKGARDNRYFHPWFKPINQAVYYAVSAAPQERSHEVWRDRQWLKFRA